ncbi:MAG: tyrosine-type recombinase/integrase [Chloroflexota bacterium]
MSDFIDSFAKNLQAKEASPKTVVNYLADLRHFARWFLASNGQELAIEEITPTDVREYKGYLLNVERRQPATVNRRLTTLRRLCAWARREGLLAEDPTEDVKGVEKVQMAPRSLEKKEVDRLIRHAERQGNKRNLVILQLLRHTGLRVSELCNLRQGDIALAERKGQVVVRSGKGGKYRVVPLNLDVRKALSAYFAVRPKNVEDDHLFIGQRDEGLRPTGVYDIVVNYARGAGLENVSPHILRHTFGKHTLDAGENLVTVAALMGHARLDTTAIYTQPSERDLEKAVEKIKNS